MIILESWKRDYCFVGLRSCYALTEIIGYMRIRIIIINHSFRIR